MYHLCLALQDPYMFTGSDVRIKDPDLDQIQFAVAFKGASWTDADSVPLMVMQVCRRRPPTRICMQLASSL